MEVSMSKEMIESRDLEEMCARLFQPGFDLPRFAEMGLEPQIEVLGHRLARIGGARLLEIGKHPPPARAALLARLLGC
jgi:hypothetical protein